MSRDGVSLVLAPQYKTAIALGLRIVSQITERGSHLGGSLKTEGDVLC